MVQTRPPPALMRTRTRCPTDRFAHRHAMRRDVPDIFAFSAAPPALSAATPLMPMAIRRCHAVLDAAYALF